MQFGGQAPVTGIVYATTMQRPDAALSLALLYGLEGKREARVASVAISENGLGAAQFADVVFRFYQVGAVPNANRSLPIGLAAVKPLPVDSVALRAPLDRKNEMGEPAYRLGIRRVNDTAEPTALMRNSLTYFPDGQVAMVLSAPATHLARMVDLPGSLELVKSKVRLLVVTEGPQRQDAAALRRVLAVWPSAVVFCGREIGQALPYPGASLAQDVAWTKAHPVVDFYSACGTMPYDAPCQDPAAILYAVKPGSDFFAAAENGTIGVSDDGRLQFAPAAGGKHQRLAIAPGKQTALLAALREVISAKPVVPQQRRRLAPEEIEKLRLQREEEQKKRDAEEKKAKPVQP